MDASLQWEIIGRLTLSAVLGAIIGLEREYRGYPAGVRTMALVCLGSALFADMSRLYGGIHIMDGNEGGMKLGEAVGKRAYERGMDLIDGK